MIELHPRNEAFYFGLEGQEKKITVAITIDWSKKIIFVSLNRNSFEIMKSFLILNKVYETDLKGAWGEKWEVDIICVKYLLGNNPWIYSFFLSDYTKIHSRRPNFFAAAIIFIKWNLKERKRGNCTVWKNWFKIWQVFGLWIFISQFSSNTV